MSGLYTANAVARRPWGSAPLAAAVARRGVRWAGLFGFVFGMPLRCRTAPPMALWRAAPGRGHPARPGASARGAPRARSRPAASPPPPCRSAAAGPGHLHPLPGRQR